METNSPQEKPFLRSKEEITSLIEQWRTSGKNKKQFCQENNLTYMTFIGWTAPKKKTKSAFIPIHVNKTLPTIFAEINLPDGSHIILHNEVSAHYLKSVLR